MANADARRSAFHRGLSALLFGCGESAVDRLVWDLQDSDDDVRQEAADALGDMGPEAAAAAPALIAALKDDDDKVRYRAFKALGKIGVVDASAKGGKKSAPLVMTQRADRPKIFMSASTERRNRS